MNGYYYFERQATKDAPAGITVSKTEELPDGDFMLKEYIWSDLTLWFVVDQEFTDKEREMARILWLGRDG